MSRKTGRIRTALGQFFGKPADSDKAQRAILREAKAERRALDEQRRQQKDLERQARIALYRQRSEALGVAGENASVVALDYQKADVRLIATSDMEREWRARSCEKEPWTVAWLEESLANGGVLYDIGANVGAFSLIAAAIVGAKGLIVAFEPGYASFAHLCDNIVLNHCQGRIIPIPLALGGDTLVATFRYKTLHAGQSRHLFEQETWDSTKAATSTRYRQPVLTMPLDEVIRQFNLPVPDHVKLDVDGAELNVLRGAASTLRSPALQSILIEVDETLTEPVTALLNDAGFALADKHKRIHDEQTQVWYGVFRRHL